MQEIKLNKLNPHFSLEDFKNFAENQSLITNYCELYADLDTPVSIYAKLKEKSEHAFLFESVIAGERIGRYSIIGFRPLEIIDGNLMDTNNCFKLLEDKISQYQPKTNTDEVLPFFHKGFVGFFPFESSSHIEPVLKLKSSAYPSIYMLLVGSLVVFDHVKQKLFLISNSLVGSKASIDELYDTSVNQLQELKEIISSSSQLDRLDLDLCLKSVDNLDQSIFYSNTGKDEFINQVDQAKQHIKEGDIFQVVLSHRMSANISIDPLVAYRMLRSINPSPYLFIFNIKSSIEAVLVGSSPEMLVKTDLKTDTDSSRYLLAENRPIAGTYKRGANYADDEVLINKLLNDQKEIAEHVMLIDLARNDLGRVCQKGSVTVPQKMIVEKYSHVLHIVSSVVGKIKSDFGVSSGVKLINACFPAGTLSGAPKIEAIKIISKLEKEARGPYGGAIGYFSLDGTMDSAILIRTLVIEKNKVSIQAGAGVVADSDPEKEWQETLNKARALISVVEAIHLGYSD
jgi:anthranilate synthase component I